MGRAAPQDGAQVPEAFTRDEWAYLVAFLDEASLRKPFWESFGDAKADGQAPLDALLRPRGLTGIWLPNNVSLLGPLTLILASFSGAPLWIKVGSNAADLTAAFVDFALKHLPDGELAEYLRVQVRIDRFDRQDPRNGEMAAAAQVRIAFGTDAAVSAIHSLPHPANSIAVSFGNHRSKVWVQKEALTDDRLTALIRVFSIYGQAGCTSPRRVVVLDGSRADAREVQERLVCAWPKVVRADSPMHVAAANVMERQLALAQGWQAIAVERNRAVVVAGEPGLPEPAGLMTLAVVNASIAEAAASLPPNIQTIGYIVREPRAQQWLELIARTAAKRFVPVEAMHHFGPVWDGGNFWRQLFEEVDLQS